MSEPDLAALLGRAAPVLVAVALVLALLALIAALAQARNVGRLRRRLDALSRGGDGRSLESVMQESLWRVDELARALHALDGRVVDLERLRPLAVQRIGLVRFNPFEDTGSNQSFALVLLDDHEDGIVVSSLHSRNATRVYAKPITGGRSDVALSDEEAEALRIARSARPTSGA
jgi:hypothetical protein